MKPRLKLESLTLLGSRKDYIVSFKDGFNLISGPTSTGKTSILEMIDYALGAKSHKSYIEIGNACSHVELIINIGNERYQIRRQLFDFNADVIVSDWNEKKQKFMFYNRFEVDVPSNPHSLSAFLIEALGLANLSIRGQAFSFRDIFKYCYIKQTEIDNEDILGEKSWEKNFKRKATFQIVYKIYNEAIEAYMKTLAEKKAEEQELSIRLAGIHDFLKRINITDSVECSQIEKRIREEITSLQSDLRKAKNDKRIETEESLKLRRDIETIKGEIDLILERKIAQTQYINKLRLLYNQYGSEIEKKKLAIEGFIALNAYEYLFCPNCLKPLHKTTDLDTCCLCGAKKGTDSSEEVLVLKKEIGSLTRKANQVLKQIEIESCEYDRIVRKESSLKRNLYEAEIELQQLSTDYINPQIERIEYLNYEIGRKNREMIDLQKNLQMFEEVDRYKQIISDKQVAIKELNTNIRDLQKNSVSEDELFSQLSSTFGEVLSAFEYPKLSNAYIDSKSYLPYVRGRKYDDIGSLAGVSLITVAYYFTLLLVGKDELFSHPNLLIIDSPRKNLGAQASDEEFKDEKIFNATIKYLCEKTEQYKNVVQVIVVNNGHPTYIPSECVVAEFDSDGREDLPVGLIDDAP